MIDGDVEIQMPEAMADLFDPPLGAVDYRAAFGGRGSAKSFNFALNACLAGFGTNLRILCTREFQSSIRESFHAELRGAIAAHPFLAAHYDVGVDYIRGKCGTEFMFKGLRHSMNNIKSFARIDLTLIEEAEDVPETAWEALLPTVMRRPKSECHVMWNPRTRGSPVDRRFRLNPMPRSIVTEVNYKDNPFFPESLDRLRASDEDRLDQATYDWVWNGQYFERSAAQIFADRFTVKDFEPVVHEWDGPYQGGDFGFSADPTAAIRCWLHDGCLYVEHEAGRTGLELDDTTEYLTSHIPQFERVLTRWDSARPESISYLKRHGLPNTQAVKKWPGSVEDGIQFIRAFKQIVIHPRCTATANEFRTYSYKTDRLTNDVLPAIVDANNHYVDALRYALAPMIRTAGQPALRML